MVDLHPYMGSETQAKNINDQRMRFNVGNPYGPNHRLGPGGPESVSAT
jgi:hypothetical protein